MKKLISIFILISFLIFSSSIVESRRIDDEDSELFMNFDDNMLPLVISSHLSDETDKYTVSTFNDKYHHPGHPKRPKRPEPSLPKRAYVYFPSPPDIASGVIVFWETRKNITLIYGQFSKGFVEGEEKDYSFKVYKNDQELADLKPDGENLDKIFKINPNGSTDIFLFGYNGTLISTLGIIGNDLVISKPDALIGKDKIKPLTC